MRALQKHFIKAAWCLISVLILCLLRLSESAALGAKHTACPDIVLLGDEFCVKLGAKYFIVNKGVGVNRHTAHRACRRRGFMADFQNETEFNGIADTLESMGLLNGNYIFWIGANDLGSEGTFKSDATGAPVAYEHWIPGEPNNYADNEHCVVLWKNNNQFGMNDAPCTSQHQYICQIESDE